MGLLSGIMKSVVNPMSLAQLAMGPAGWASLAFKAIGSQLAMNLIQQVGQQMGLPKATIDLAQTAFASASGQPGLARQNIGEAVSELTSQFNLSPSQAGQLQRDLLGASDKSYSNMNRIIENSLKRMSKSEGEEEGGSLLMKIARALGQLMDDKMNKLSTKADELGRVGQDTSNTINKGDNKGTFNAKGQGEFGKLSAEVQALSQELGYLSQAVSSSIKGIGEAASTVARK